MLYLTLLLTLLPQVTVTPAQEPPAPTTAPTYDQGPLRVELLAMREVRLRASDPVMAARMESDLRMQFRIQGEKLMQLARFGNLILTEMVDDTGQALIGPDTYSEAERTQTRPVGFPVERLRENGLMLTTRSKVSARAAKTLKTMRGSVRLVLAEGSEKVTIINPLQYLGQTIDNPRLKELGIEVEVVPMSEIENAPPGERSLILHYKTKSENVQGATFADGAMRPVPARETQIAKKSGEPCQLYYFDPSVFNDEMQLVLEVHPKVEDIQLPVEMKDVELP